MLALGFGVPHGLMFAKVLAIQKGSNRGVNASDIEPASGQAFLTAALFDEGVGQAKVQDRQ
jgi:hypothetical protein